MNIAWDPLLLAAVALVATVVLYLYDKAPRFSAVCVAATVLFVTVSFRPLLALAHRPVTSAAELLIIAAGAAGAGWLFYLIMLRGHHKHPLVKHKGAPASGPGGAGPATGGAAGRKSAKGPHHRAMLVTVAAMVFTFLLVSNWPQIAHMGRGGFSQTINGITQ